METYRKSLVDLIINDIFHNATVRIYISARASSNEGAIFYASHSGFTVLVDMYV